MVTAIASEWVTAINSESVTAFIVIRNRAIEWLQFLKGDFAVAQTAVCTVS
jgi:hypothetical protein